jgi:hypothetical protein
MLGDPLSVLRGFKVTAGGNLGLRRLFANKSQVIVTLRVDS